MTGLLLLSVFVRCACGVALAMLSIGALCAQTEVSVMSESRLA